MKERAKRRLPLQVPQVKKRKKKKVMMMKIINHACWGPSSSEGPQKHDLTMFSKCDI
jgi:hypothetical protein